MDFDENNYEPLPTDGEELPEEENNNRTFMIAVGILGGLILIAVACLGVMYLVGGTSASTSQVAADQSVSATETAIANQITIQQALTLTAQASLPTPTLSPTPTATPPVAPPSPTGTPDAILTAAAGGGGAAGTQVAATATVAAALTSAANAQQTVTMLPSPTHLATSGIADEYGLPGLVVMALAFIIVILFARRLRVSPTAR